MDKDIREFLDRAEHNRLYKMKRKRKEKRLAKQLNRQKKESLRNATLNNAELKCGDRAKGDDELRQLAYSRRDYGKRTKAFIIANKTLIVDFPISVIILF